MNDLDTRLAAHYAGLAPPADFDARLGARLAAEREHEARRDRAAALRVALERHERARQAASRAWRRALWRILGLGLAACLLLASTLPAWRSLGELLAATATPARDTHGLAAFALLAFAIVLVTLPARWRAALWSTIAR